MSDAEADDLEAWLLALKREPITRAELLGHTVKSDPPFALSAVERWTCTSCGESVLRNRDVIDGGAVKKKCGADDA